MLHMFLENPLNGITLFSIFYFYLSTHFATIARSSTSSKLRRKDVPNVDIKSRAVDSQLKDRSLQSSKMIRYVFVKWKVFEQVKHDILQVLNNLNPRIVKNI